MEMRADFVRMGVYEMVKDQMAVFSVVAEAGYLWLK